VGRLANGTLVEFHYMASEANKAVYKELPEPKDGWLDLPTTPGLGFEIDRDKLNELLKT
jgi:L-rhamnonate dehydratase